MPSVLLVCIAALAQIRHWPSVHVALSNGTVFVDFHCDRNGTVGEMIISLVDMETNVTVAQRPVPANQSEGTVEFNCPCFLYAGKFRFRLQLSEDAGSCNATDWWSEVLHVQWPTFIINVERSSNKSSGSFQIAISTSAYFEPCSTNSSSLYLEVSYVEYNLIGRNSIDKVRKIVTKEIGVVKSQSHELDCMYPFTERDFITVSLKSKHTHLDIKSSGRLYLSQLFSYKLLVDNTYKAGCEGTVAVRLLPPPCAFTHGKVVLYREGSGGSGVSDLPVAFNWLSQGENETEFNCSLFDPGRNKYCLKFILNFSSSPSRTQICLIVQRNTETWGLWLSWSSCSVSCGEGVRERYRECLAPSTGRAHCTGLQRELSHCSLEDCTAPSTSPSLAPVPPENSAQTGNMVAVAGISLCLVVIVATVLITVWRKLCQSQKCSSVRRHSSVHSPGFRKNSDEVSIYCQRQQCHSFTESLEALPEKAGEGFEKSTMGRRQSHPLSPDQNVAVLGESLSPSAQKIIPPIFGYRLAQQQLKEMKKKGLKEATKVYHVSQNPLDDTVLNTATTAPVPESPDSQEEAALNRFRLKSPFLEAKSPTSLERLSPKVDFMLSQLSQPPLSPQLSGDWVEMVERGYPRHTQFRRTSSFHETKLPRPFRERSMSSGTTRQLASTGYRIRSQERHPESTESRPKSRLGDLGEGRLRPWNGRLSPQEAGAYYPRMEHVAEGVEKPDLLGDRRLRAWTAGAEKPEPSRTRRGPSPIQRNIMARKLKDANSAATHSHQRSATLSPSQFRRDKCKSLPLDPEEALYHSSHYGLTEVEQRMMDLSGFFGEEEET
ncbi:THSD1 protein, partial [Amia calva]|nr:THSD1 protein [Amia calva]